MNAEQYGRLKELFHTAMLLDAAKHEAFITESCAGDTELAQELRTLLTHASGDPLLTQTGSQHRPRSGSTTHRGSTRRQSRLSIAQSFAWLTSPRFRWLHAWVPVVLATVLSVLITWWLHERVRLAIAEARHHELLSILRGDVAAIELLLDRERTMVTALAQASELRREIAALVTLPESRPSPTSPDGKLTTARDSLLKQVRAATSDDAECAVWDRQMITIIDATGETTSEPITVGRPVTERGAQLLNRVFSGQTVVLRPDYNFMLAKPIVEQPDEIAMGMLAPIYDPDDDERIVAALMVRRSALVTAFDAILLNGRFENTGEAYVFNRQGTMLSESRFVDQLLRCGLLEQDSQQPNAASARLRLRIKDPGGDLTRGYTPKVPRAAQPLTEMLRMAAENGEGVNVEGYRDYRGVTVVGAWNWIKDPDIGIAIEVDYDEAFRPLRFVLHSAVATGLVIFGWTVALASSTIRTLRARATLRRVGPYHLVRRIGKGGMGEVYLAEHALLKRPTAVKLIRPDKTTHQTVAWFEREVHAISQLTHPNTIQIYDYGHTEDGTFYYSMEYLDGFDVEALVRLEGQVSPERTVYLLRQACLSLREAHGRQLVHRDIKPHNIMLCARGGEYDVVKLLDFGLVKDIAGEAGRVSSLTNVVAGTPAYMAPERLSDPLRVDGRADIFAIGAVAYRMLTGADPFEGRIVMYDPQHAQDETMRPSRRSRYQIPTALDDLIRACLAPLPDDRPANVQQLLDTFDGLEWSEPWTPAAAEQWWGARGFVSKQGE